MQAGHGGQSNPAAWGSVAVGAADAGTGRRTAASVAVEGGAAGSLVRSAAGREAGRFACWGLMLGFSNEKA